jgi:hypothetical protein
VRVILLPAGFDPGRDGLAPKWIDTTDNLGRFQFPPPDTGFYQVEARHLENGRRCFRGGIHYLRGIVEVGWIALGETGVLRVVLPDTVNPSEGRIFVPGTTINAPVGASRFLNLDSLPAMHMGALVYAKGVMIPGTDREAVTVIARDLDIRPMDTSEVSPSPAWKYQGRLMLNTSSTGAVVGEDLLGFPMLLRLDSSNFDFSQGFPDGAPGF